MTPIVMTAQEFCWIVLIGVVDLVLLGHALAIIIRPLRRKGR